jgi:hypothetical protein
MKKLAVALSLLAVAAGAFAQGSITVANTSTTQFRTNAIGVPSNGGTAGLALSATGPGYYYELLTAPSTVTTIDTSLQALLTPTWSDTGLRATNTALAGRMSGSTTTVNNWAPGVTQSRWAVFREASWSAAAPCRFASALD